MRVLIAGGGIGGLSAAIAMRRLGHEVVIVERAPELSEVGASIACQSNAMRALNFLGAGDYVRTLNDPPDASQHIDVVSGRVTMSHVLRDAASSPRETRMHMCHRRDLIDGLAGQIQGAELCLNSPIAATEQNESSVRLILEDGRTLEGDILIGADGLRSTVRASLFGPSEAVFTGYLAWRTVVPAGNYRRVMPNTVRLWSGSGRHVVAYPIRKGTQIYASFYVPAGEVQREDWGSSGDVADLRASFGDASAELQEVLEGIDQAFITGVFYRPPLEKWHLGRTLLMGDAAHPVLPTSGSGAAITLEDGVALHGCMERHGDNYQAAFSEFQARRHARTTAVLILSRSELQNFHETDPERRAIRARVNAGIDRLAGARGRAWLQGYDEVAQSQRPIAEILAQTQNPLKRPEARRAFDRWRSIFKPEDHIHGVLSMRDGYERLMGEMGQLPPDIKVEEVDCNGLSALRLIPPHGDSGPAVLHLSGGGYALGSARSSAALAARIARAAGGWALVPDIRRVPEHTVKNMSEDVLAAYDFIAARSERIFVSGESGGAGLALSLGIALREQKRRQPLAMWLLSPFLDASLTAESIRQNARTEAWLDWQTLLTLAGALTQGDDPTRAQYSPINHDLTGFPPLYISAAADEALVGDALSLHEKAVAADIPAKITLLDDSVHCYAQFPYLPEADDFIESVRQEVGILLGRSGQATPS